MKLKQFLINTAAISALFIGGAVAQVINQSAQMSQDPRGPLAMDTNLGFYFPAHILSVPSAKTTPALTSCGTTPTIAGSDTAGTVTMGTGGPTGCVITFGTAFVTAPNCVVNWQATPLASQSWTVTTTAITLVQTATSSNKVNYICLSPS